MGCAASTTGETSYDRHHESSRRKPATPHDSRLYDDRSPTPPPDPYGTGDNRKPKPKPVTPPPKDPTPPPREPTPPPREPTPPPREPTPPPREPTPPPPPPPKQPTPPPGDDIQHEGYQRDPLGIYCKAVDFRKHRGDLDKPYSQYPHTRGGQYLDQEFPLHVAIRGQSNLEWKRPTEIRDNPTLFTGGTTRFDIGQGGAGTCWFLSMVACLADKQAYIDQIIPRDGYHKDDGVFECQFWRFGEWERVHIDDSLPVIYGDQFWGAKSKDDPNEVWVPLLEKAFARFHGSYNAIYGGQSGDAYLALTGGCSEYINLDKDGISDKYRLFQRIENAVSTGSILCTEVPDKYDGHCGLVGGHAYSLTGCKKVKSNRGEVILLVRVRNPWGHTEWKGPWRDGGPEWDQIPPGSVKHANRDDGEFYMEIDDFMTYFSGVTICSLTPDFDKDGCADTLNFKTNIFGDWEPGCDGDFHHRTNNPRYVFHLSDEGMDDEGMVPLVVQLVQKTEHRKTDVDSIRVDLFRVMGENQDARCPTYVVELLGDVTNVYKTEKQMTMRYKVEPGDYMIIPSTMKGGVHKEYLIRVFAPCPLLDIRESTRDAITMDTKFDDIDPSEINDSSVDRHLCVCQCLFGSWRAGENAGGQVARRETFHTNPQIEFEIPNRGRQLVTFSLMQNTSQGKQYPIGLRVFPCLQPLPVDVKYLYDHYESCPRSIKGDDGTFVNGDSFAVTYLLDPGRYFILLHEDDPSQETDFALIVKSSCHIELRPYQMGR